MPACQPCPVAKQTCHEGYRCGVCLKPGWSPSFHCCGPNRRGLSPRLVLDFTAAKGYNSRAKLPASQLCLRLLKKLHPMSYNKCITPSPRNTQDDPNDHDEPLVPICERQPPAAYLIMLLVASSKQQLLTKCHDFFAVPVVCWNPEGERAGRCRGEHGGRISLHFRPTTPPPTHLSRLHQSIHLQDDPASAASWKRLHISHLWRRTSARHSKSI